MQLTFTSRSMWQDRGRPACLFCIGSAGTTWWMGTGSVLKHLSTGRLQACGRLVQLAFSGMLAKLLILKKCSKRSDDMGAVTAKTGGATDKKESLVQ